MIREITDVTELKRHVEPGEKFYIGDEYDKDGEIDAGDYTLYWAYRIPESVRIEDVVGNYEKYWFDDEGIDEDEDNEIYFSAYPVYVDKAGKIVGPYPFPG